MVKILIPCYNEEQNLKDTILGWRELYPEAFIVVCDNNSTDNSYNIAKEYADKVIIEKIQGKGAAVKKLLKENFDIAILIDADNEVLPNKEFLPLEDNDLIIGYRTNYKNHWLNHLGNFFSNIIFKILYKYKPKDILCGYRAFTKEFANSLILSDGFEIEIEMLAQAVKQGRKIKWIPVNYQPTNTSKMNRLKDGYKLLKTLFKNA